MHMVASSGLPSDVRTSLGLLAPGHKHAFALRKIQEYREQIAELNQSIELLKSVANNDTPILRLLPNELFIEVFRYLRPTKRAEICIAHVCRAWRTILCGTPEFWADLASIPDHSTAKPEDDWSCYLSCLTLSSPQALSLSLRGNRIPRMPEMRAHHPRITSLTLTFADSQLSEHLTDLYELFRLGLPSLEQLDLTVHDAFFEGITDVPEFGQHDLSSDIELPRLRILRTHGVFFTAFLARDSLRHLTLINERPMYLGNRTYLEARSYPELLEALQRCPALETLDLAYSMPRGPELDFTGPPDYFEPCVTLSKLRAVTISDETWHVRRFFEAVSFPPTTSVTIHNLAPDRQHAYAEALPRTRLLEVIPGLERMTLHFDDSAWKCSVRGFVGGDTERFAMHTTWLYELDGFPLADIREVFTFGPLVTDLDVVFGAYHSHERTSESWDQLLTNFYNIGYLGLQSIACSKLAEALSRQTSGAYPLPRLEELQIRCFVRDGSELEAEKLTFEGAIRVREAAGLKLRHWSILDVHVEDYVDQEGDSD
ncbi:hypothetical protein ONZ51_g3564 [Trametes cubensis]|uniref:F-box domain-containing protein n=1 Tax=Trametes cubensis TaxID=1111947 RepID=A0AAD7TXG2_9APHY|nr:hypothetical protein ONZ51_g3564 [Trametes cubensis]